MSELLHFSGTYTDQYEIAMAEVYFLSGREKEHAVFDYFFRKLPFGSGYSVFAGLEDLLGILEELKFTEEDLDFLRKQHHDEGFLSYLKSFHFSGSIYSCDEGEVIFPYAPVLRVEAPLIEAQLIETLLLNVLNFETLIATKAARIRYAAGKRTLLEFGLRRAQGPGGLFATRASMIGGFDGTSNVMAAKKLSMKASGTMAHSYIQSEENELFAFRNFVSKRPDDSVLLLDTYNTLKSGLPHAIVVAKDMERAGRKLKAIRLDSGDLAYLSKECRRILDENNLRYVKIIASNQLDEHVILSLQDQGAPIDVYGVGTKLVTGAEDGALDGVYKLCEINGRPAIKLSENISKISLPSKKQIYRLVDHDQKFAGDIITLQDEEDPDIMFHPVDPLSSFNTNHYIKEPLLKLQMKNGHRRGFPQTIPEIREFSEKRLAQLPDEYKRFANPHLYKVGLSRRLKERRDVLIKEHREKYL